MQFIGKRDGALDCKTLAELQLFSLPQLFHVCRREAVGGSVRFSDLHCRLAPQEATAGLRLRRQGGQIRQQSGGGHRQTVWPS